jgi:hypothetical protein
VLLNFTVTGGSATTFHLLQTGQLGMPWATNTTATFSTNVPGGSYRYTDTNSSAVRYYRVQTP